MSKQPQGRIPNSTEKYRIRTHLCLSRDEPFLRCKARDQRKVRAFEAAGDMSHSAARHVCDECRCDHVAGAYTNDDFYDVEGVGHYGVGFCWHHEQGRYRVGALSFARSQMRALQQHGKLAAENENYSGRNTEELTVERCAGMPLTEASRVEQVTNARNTVSFYLNKMVMLMEGDGNIHPQEVIDTLEDLRETINDAVAADLMTDGYEVIQRINSIFTHDLFMTEKCGKDVIPMTFATKMAKIKDLAVAASKIGLDDFRMTEKDYVEKRIVALKLRQTMADMGKELAPEFGDEVADRVRQNLVDRVFLPIWGEL